MSAAFALPDASTPSAPAALPKATPEQLARITKVSRDFESSFLSIMLGEMSAGVKSSSFGGGEGEDAFKSFMNEAMAKSMTAHGGIGLAPKLQSEMLRMQGLTA